jgi:hypothetical protein
MAAVCGISICLIRAAGSGLCVTLSFSLCASSLRFCLASFLSLPLLLRFQHCALVLLRFPLLPLPGSSIATATLTYKSNFFAQLFFSTEECWVKNKRWGVM